MLVELESFTYQCLKKCSKLTPGKLFPGKNAETKDQMTIVWCGYFSTFPYHQVLGFQILPKTDGDVIAQAVLLTDCTGKAVDCGADSGVLTR